MAKNKSELRVKDGFKQKKCSKCEEWVNLNNSNYYKNSNTQDGFNSMCKACQKESSKKSQIKQMQETTPEERMFRKKQDERIQQIVKDLKAPKEGGEGLFIETFDNNLKRIPDKIAFALSRVERADSKKMIKLIVLDVIDEMMKVMDDDSLHIKI